MSAPFHKNPDSGLLVIRTDDDDDFLQWQGLMFYTRPTNNTLNITGALIRIGYNLGQLINAYECAKRK